MHPFNNNLYPLFVVSEDDLRQIIDDAEENLLCLRSAHILLTGCTGFLGRWLVEALLRANRDLSLALRLYVLTRSAKRTIAAMPQWQEHAELSLLEGDVTSWKPAAHLGLTHIVHGANLTQTGTEDWALRHLDTAVLGSRQILELARREKCQTMLLLSSGAVYGLRGEGASSPYQEKEQSASDMLCEADVYACGKFFTERYATAYGLKYGIRVPIARLFTFMGAHMPLGGSQALGSFLQNALRGEDIVIQGDGTSVRSYMHAADMTVWLLALLVRGEHGVPCNVGSDVPVSIAALAHSVSDAFGGRSRVRILSKTARGNGTHIYVPNTDRARQKYRLSLHSKNFLQEVAATSYADLHDAAEVRETYTAKREVPKNCVCSKDVSFPRTVALIVFDFDGVFTDNRVLTDQNGTEAVLCSRSDSLGIAMLRKARVPMLILSTETNTVVSARGAKLGIPVCQACGDKAAFLKLWLETHKIPANHVIYMGNDINDLDAMRLVGFICAPADSHADVRSVAHCVTRACGGRGAVRELAEMLLETMREEIDR